MQNNRAKGLKGLGIAVIVIAAISLVGCILAIVACVMGGLYVDHYGIGPLYIDNGPGPGYELKPHEARQLASFGIVAAIALMGWAVVMNIVVLIAGIIGLRRADRPEKMGGVFALSIAGAVCALLGGKLISVVLLVIMAVIANQIKNAPDGEAAAAPFAAPAVEFAAAPVAAPVEPATPATPVVSAYDQAYGTTPANSGSKTQDQA